MDRAPERRAGVAVAAVAAVVGLAFADSSIVVLALPQLYGRFHTSIQGVAWVLTAYNIAVAGGALALVFCVHRLGAALLLAGSLPVLVALTGSATAGATVWTLAGTFGAALGPTLGGAL